MDEWLRAIELGFEVWVGRMVQQDEQRLGREKTLANCVFKNWKKFESRS